MINYTRAYYVQQLSHQCVHTMPSFRKAVSKCHRSNVFGAIQISSTCRCPSVKEWLSQLATRIGKKECIKESKEQNIHFNWSRFRLKSVDLSSSYCLLRILNWSKSFFFSLVPLFFLFFLLDPVLYSMYVAQEVSTVSFQRGEKTRTR